MATIDKQLAKDCVRRGVLYGFVPHHLAIPDRPELDVFPFNVMFMKFKVENGITISGTALYEPLFTTYHKAGTKCTMDYFNIYGPQCWLRIEFDYLNKSYLGEKFVNGETSGKAAGREWKMFFLHFTMLGLSNGERCKFEEMPFKEIN